MITVIRRIAPRVPILSRSPGFASRASRIPARKGNRRGICWWKALSTAKMALTGAWVAIRRRSGWAVAARC